MYPECSVFTDIFEEELVYVSASYLVFTFRVFWVGLFVGGFVGGVGAFVGLFEGDTDGAAVTGDLLGDRVG